MRMIMVRNTALSLLLACGLSAACPAQAEPERDGSNVLRIPGFPPIPMPPGVRVYGGEGNNPAPEPRAERPKFPHVAPKGLPPKEQAQKPLPQKQAKAPNLPPEALRAKILDELFKRLAASADTDDAQGITSAIERVWMRSGSDTSDLLMARATQAMHKSNPKLAIEILSRITVLHPEWAEAWNKRATLRFINEDYDGSMRDIEQVLKLEPRHYGALVGMGNIFLRTDDKKGALAAYRRALGVHPQMGDLKPIVEKLQLEVEGQDI